MPSINRSHLQVRITEFGADTEIPMAFPPNVSVADLTKVARNYLGEGKAQRAQVIDTSRDVVMWSGEWTLTTSDTTSATVTG